MQTAGGYMYRQRSGNAQTVIVNCSEMRTEGTSRPSASPCAIAAALSFDPAWGYKQRQRSGNAQTVMVTFSEMRTEGMSSFAAVVSCPLASPPAPGTS